MLNGRGGGNLLWYCNENKVVEFACHSINRNSQYRTFSCLLRFSYFTCQASKISKSLKRTGKRQILRSTSPGVLFIYITSNISGVFERKKCAKTHSLSYMAKIRHIHVALNKYFFKALSDGNIIMEFSFIFVLMLSWTHPYICNSPC